MVNRALALDGLPDPTPAKAADPLVDALERETVGALRKSLEQMSEAAAAGGLSLADFAKAINALESGRKVERAIDWGVVRPSAPPKALYEGDWEIVPPWKDMPRYASERTPEQTAKMARRRAELEGLEARQARERRKELELEIARHVRRRSE